MSAPDLIAGFYGTNGVLLGVQVNGMIVCPNSLAAGILMQDSSGAWWQLTIGTDGRISANPVTI